MKAMIFAAGLGTRLSPITDTMPKALVPVAGKPLLFHVVDRIHSAGFHDFVVNTHHFSGQIAGYIASEPFGEHVNVTLSDEQPEPLETGGGILNAADLLRGSEYILVHNVDILSNLDLQAFVSAATSCGKPLATLLVSDRQTSRYLLFDDDMHLVGWTNVSTGQVRSPYPDLDPSKCRKLAFAGIHVVSERIFEVMRSLGFDGKFSIIDFYLAACRDHLICGYVQPGLRLMDVGKIDTLAKAEEFLQTL